MKDGGANNSHIDLNNNNNKDPLGGDTGFN